MGRGGAGCIGEEGRGWKGSMGREGNGGGGGMRYGVVGNEKCNRN